MSTWAYDLGDTGRQLRDAIHTDERSVESCKCTLECLIKCFDRIDQMCPKDISDHFDYYREGIDESLDDLGCLDLGFVGEEDYFYAEDIVNEWLDTFYDLCDMYRIWVGL